MAEFYRVYDWRALPVKYTATLVSGLGEKSRTFKALAGVSYDIDTMLLAAAVDYLALLWWGKTKDGQKNRSRPKRIVDSLIKEKKKKTDLVSFSDGESFKEARRRLLEGVKQNGD